MSLYHSHREWYEVLIVLFLYPRSLYSFVHLILTRIDTTCLFPPPVPGSAVLEELLSINSTSVTLFLDAIPVGLCTISDIRIAYKPQGIELNLF